MDACFRFAIRFRGAELLKRSLDVVPILARPRPSADAEARLESFGAELGDRRALVRDDKDGSKMWVVDAQMGYLKILSAETSLIMSKADGTSKLESSAQ